MCRALEKTASEIPTGVEEEMVAAVMYLQGNETSGGSDGKEQRATWENRAKGRNEPSR